VLALFSPDLLSQSGRRIKRQPCGIGTGSLGQVGHAGTSGAATQPLWKFGLPLQIDPAGMSKRKKVQITIFKDAQRRADTWAGTPGRLM
jgi:hypothetical protein